MLKKYICPICNKPNHCAMEEGKDPSTCWCMNEIVPKDLLDSLSPEDKDNRCI